MYTAADDCPLERLNQPRKEEKEEEKAIQEQLEQKISTGHKSLGSPGALDNVRDMPPQGLLDNFFPCPNHCRNSVDNGRNLKDEKRRNKFV